MLLPLIPSCSYISSPTGIMCLFQDTGPRNGNSCRDCCKQSRRLEMVLYYLNGFCSVYRIVESYVHSFDASSAEQIRSI